MKKLIPKYQKGRWLRVKIKNTDRNKPGKYGYIDVDDNNRPWEWDESRPNLFMVHPDSPSSEGYWTEIDTDSSNDYNHNIPTYDLSTVIITPKNREEIEANKAIELNNANYYLYNNAGDEVLRDWQLAQQLGSASRVWFDASGMPHREFGEQGMSGADPIGRFYVEGVGLGKAIEGGIKAGRYLKELRNAARPKNVLSAYYEIYEPSQRFNEFLLFKLQLDNIRRKSILDYINTGAEKQPILEYGIKPIDYSKFLRLKTEGFPQGTLTEFRESVFPRMILSRMIEKERALRKSNILSEEEIQLELLKYEEHLHDSLNKMLKNKGFILVNKPVMEEYNYSHSSDPSHVIGFYDKYGSKNIVVGSDEDDFNFLKTLNHEVRHYIDDFFPLTSDEKHILGQAYNNIFDELPNIYSGYTKGILMDLERVTTNADARQLLLRKFNKGLKYKSIQELNKFIDDIPDYEIVNAIESANGYGGGYIRELRERDMLTPELVQALRDAIKYVGMSTAAVTVANLLNK